jgi:hypothetical protein
MPAIAGHAAARCRFMFVCDAGRAIGAERPEALAYIALEFFERRDLFLVSRESGMAFPESQERKIRDRLLCADIAAVRRTSRNRRADASHSPTLR